MTTINAIRFSRFSGAMVCDEQRHWNPERLKIYAADKIRKVVPDHLLRKYGIAAAYGNTGTSSIGDELRLTIYREIESRYERLVAESGGTPDTFLSFPDIARLTWDVIRRVKHDHIDSELEQKYGFNTADFIAGYREKDGVRKPIDNPDVVRDAMNTAVGPADKPRTGAVFGNGGILAGFDPENGFGIYNYSMRDGIMEPVESGYVALGSGGDSTNFVLPAFFNAAGVTGRENGIDPVKGLTAVIDAVNTAADRNLGVGGYVNIIIFDASADDPAKQCYEINDHRSKLVSETVKACRLGFISSSACFDIVDGLIFSDRDIDWGETKLWESTSRPLEMHRMLRGYPVY